MKEMSTAYTKSKTDWRRMLRSDFARNKYIYSMAIPVLLYYIVFHYVPMYGAIIAFKNYSPGRGILGSPWVGFTHFITFFTSRYFLRTLRNTFLISFYNLLFGFPAPIILAILLNELRSRFFKSAIQTMTYLPHFISLVVVCGMIKVFAANNGIINNILMLFGHEQTGIMDNPALFRPIYVATSIWQEIGWGSIIYLSALTAINAELYEAARIDGAGRFRQLIHVTIPGILPTIVIMLILRMGKMLSVGYEKIILLYNPLTYETGEVISSYVYKVGLQQFNWSFSTAIGLFNSLINFVFLICTNQLSRSLNDTSLW